MKKERYLTSEQIYEQWLAWKSTGVVSEEMGKMMLMLAQRIMTSRHFHNYPQYMKDEMIQDGCLKIIANLKNMKEEKRKSFFAYWTRCVWTAAIVYLGKHYKYMNNKRKLMLEAIAEAASQSNIPLSQYIQQLDKDVRRTLEGFDKDLKKSDDDV